MIFFGYSLLFGNIYSYFVLKGSTDITDDERTKLFIGLSGAALLGVLCFLLLRKPVSTDTENLVNLSPRSGCSQFIEDKKCPRMDN